MRRRTVLRRSAALGAVAVAGCSGDGDDDDGTPTSTPEGLTGFGDYSTETTGTECDSGSAGSAEVTFDADALSVTVVGALEASNPCHRAAMEGLNYDRENDELRVTIAPKARDVDGCQQCVGAIDYETTFELEGGLPGTVVVRHGSGSDAEEVARADSNDA